MFDRRADRAPRSGQRPLFPEVRERLIELSNLAIGSPAKVALTRLPQIHARDLLEAARRVEARGQFVGERLVVDEAVGAGRADGLFVEAHRINIAAVDAGDLRAHQGGAVLEILRAVRRPHFELTVVGGYSLDMVPALLACREIVERGVGKRAIKVILRRLEP